MQADYTKPDAHTKEAYNSTKDMPSYNLQVYKKLIYPIDGTIYKFQWALQNNIKLQRSA